MELKEAIELRRSIRHYNDKELSKEIINDLLDCARLAPSAMNRQPWFFVVLKSEKKNRIADMMIKWCDLMMEDSETKKDYLSSVKFTAGVIKEANTLILVFQNNDDLDYKDFDNLSIGACIENILLRATDLGIGSLWIGHTSNVKKQIEELFNYDNLEFNSAIALGYTDVNPKMRPRKELKDIVTYIV